MAFTNSDDINVLQASDAAIVGAGLGNDTYIVSPVTLTDGQVVTLSDADGVNTLQLIDGLTIASSIVVSNALQLTLSNGAIINLNGADTFTFNLGGNDITGVPGVDKDFATFATDALGVTVPAEGEDPVTGGGGTVNEDGTVSGGGETYALAADATTVDEGATATFTLTTTNVAEGTEVAYTITGVDAADIDGALTGTATVGADGTATISVSVLDDGVVDEGETLTVSIDGQTATASTAITDTGAPTPAALSIADMTVAEDGGSVTFTVTLAGDAPAAGESVTVNYTTADGTAIAGTDYTTTAGSLTFGEGVSTQEITVPITDNLLVDGDKAFTVVLSDAAGTVGGTAATISDDTATGTITDNDVAVVIDSYTLTADAASVTEGNAVTFTATALDADGNPAAVAEDTTFNYQISGVEVAGGTADPATDLGKVTGTVTILAGQSTGTFTLTPSDDGVTEGFEGFKVSMLDDSFVSVAESGNVVIKDGAEAGKTYTLTTATDSITGTSGNDTINGVVQGNGTTGTTAAPGDSINAGDGTDTLNISVAGDLDTATGKDNTTGSHTDYTLSALSTTGLEKVFLSNFDTDEGTDGTGDNIVATDLMNGLTTVGLSASSTTGDTTFTGMNSIVDAVMNNGAGDLTLTYGAAAVAGTTDAQNLEVSNLTGGTFTAAGVETLNVTTGLVKSTVTALSATDATTINVAGASDLTVNTALTTKTIDASSMTGALNVSLGAATQTVKGGAGNDVVDASTNLGATDKLDGGDGTDTLKLSVGNSTIDATATTGELVGVTNFETIQVNSTHDSAKLDLDGYTGVSTVEAAANVRSVTVTGTIDVAGEDLAYTLNGETHSIATAAGTDTAAEIATELVTSINALSGFSAVSGGAGVVTITSTSGEAIEFSSLVNTTDPTDAIAFTQGDYNDVTFSNLEANTALDIYSADAVDASLKDASGASDVLSLNLKTVAADKGFDHSVGTITANNIETVNLSANGMTDGKVTTVGALADNAMTTLNITGDSDLTISGFTGSNKLATIDGSTATGDLILAAAPAAIDQTIKTGSGNDTINMAGFLTAADTIDGGANTVLSTGLAGTDTLNATGNIGSLAVATALNIANVETINVAIGTAATTYIDAAKITGASNLAFSATSGTVKVTNLAADTKIGLGTGTDEMVGTLDLALADSTGTADAISLDFGDLIDTTGATVALKVASTVETLNISASKEANADTWNLTNTNMAAKNIVVTDGVAADTLALGTLNAATTNVDASAYKGKLTMEGATGVAMTASANGTVVNTITTSTGADTVTLAGKLGITIQDISGGTGTDVLNVTADNSATDFTSVDGFETINITVGGNNQAGFDDATKDNGLNLATNINLLGGDSLSSFTVGGTDAVITDAGSVQSIDASAFAGKIDLTLDANALDANMTIKGGALLTDKVTTSVSTDTTGEIVKSMTGVETLVLKSVNSDPNAVIDLANVSGLTTLDAQFVTAGGADQLSVKKLASGTKVKATSTTTGDNLVIDLADKALTTNSLDLELAAFTNATDVLNFDAAGVETLNITTKAAGVIDLAGVDATSATGKVAVNVAGATALTFNSLNADINAIDASTATGGITLEAAHRGSSAMTITTGYGNDIVAMENAADVLTGGSGTDTLKIASTLILGGVEVNLASTTDQITTFNGSANTAAQVGFENVDLSGIAGSFGAQVTAAATGSTIVGTSNADIITGGAGIDTITGRDGADTIDLGSDSSADNYVISAITDGGALGDDETSNADTVNNFDQGEDDVNIATALEAALTNGNQDGTLDVATFNQNGLDKDTNDKDVFILTGTTVDDLDDLSDVITGVGTVTTTASDAFFMVVNNAAGTQAGLYYVGTTTDANAGVALIEAELALVGIINTDSALTATEFELM